MISNLLLYSEQQWGIRQRERYQQDILDGLRRLLTFPHLGKARPDYQPGARSIRIEQYIAIYRVTDDEVRISRIVHERRDIDAVEIE
jgi:toxin ParE1/3/4